MNISISRDGVEIGTWTDEEVRSLYEEGKLLPTDFYWKEGMTEWVELYKMIPPTPAAMSKPVLKTQVIAPVENKFTQHHIMSVPRVHVDPKPSITTIKKEPNFIVKLIRKLFKKGQ
jgi:hypothetical protein